MINVTLTPANRSGICSLPLAALSTESVTFTGATLADGVIVTVMQPDGTAVASGAIASGAVQLNLNTVEAHRATNGLRVGETVVVWLVIGDTDSLRFAVPARLQRNYLDDVVPPTATVPVYPTLAELNAILEAVQTAKEETQEILEKAEQIDATIGTVVDEFNSAVTAAETLIQQTVADGVTSIDSAKTAALGADDDRKAQAVGAVATAENEAVGAVGTAKETAVGDINTAKTGAVNDVNAAKDGAVQAVGSAQTTALGAVQNAQTTAVNAVDTAKAGAISAVDQKVAQTESQLNAKVAEAAGSAAAAETAKAAAEAAQAGAETAQTIAENAQHGAEAAQTAAEAAAGNAAASAAEAEAAAAELAGVADLAEAALPAALDEFEGWTDKIIEANIIAKSTVISAPVGFIHIYDTNVPLATKRVEWIKPNGDKVNLGATVADNPWLVYKQTIACGWVDGETVYAVATKSGVTYRCTIPFVDGEPASVTSVAVEGADVSGTAMHSVKLSSGFVITSNGLIFNPDTLTQTAKLTLKFQRLVTSSTEDGVYVTTADGTILVNTDASGTPITTVKASETDTMSTSASLVKVTIPSLYYTYAVSGLCLGAKNETAFPTVGFSVPAILQADIGDYIINRWGIFKPTNDGAAAVSIGNNVPLYRFKNLILNIFANSSYSNTYPAAYRSGNSILFISHYQSTYQRPCPALIIYKETE